MNALVLVNAGEELPLHGAGVSDPVRGARRVECTAAEGGWLERVEVYFEGPPGAVRDRQAQIERILSRPGVRLRLEAYPGADTVEARLAGGRCETLAWNSGGGASALRLELLRGEPWQGAETTLPLSTPGESGTEGVILYGHADAGHWNYADIPGSSLAGDQPGQVRLEVEHGGTSGILGDMLVCVDAGEASGLPGLLLEGETAAGGSRVTPAGCSGGAAQQVEADSATGALLAWALDGDLLARLAGRTVRPAARLAQPPAAGTVWAWWQVRSGPALIWSSERDLLAGETLAELPALPLPPQSLSGPAGLTLELCGKTAGGAASFSVDFVQLCPLDGWRRYRAAAALEPGECLVDDGFERRVYARTAAGAVSSYAAAGAPLRLAPGRDQRLYLLHSGEVDAPVRVRAWYRPGWGSL